MTVDVDVLVYTAVIQYNPAMERDTVARPSKECARQCKHVLFTNVEPALFAQCGWDEVVRVTPTEEELDKWPTVLAKRIKWTPWDFYDLTPFRTVVWVDACSALTGTCFATQIAPPAKFCTKLPLITRRHPVRTCIYDECRAVVSGGRDTAQAVAAVIDDLGRAGMPRKFGLPETCVVIFNPHDAGIRAFNKGVQTRTATASHRDQLAFTLVLFQQGHTFGDVGTLPPEEPGVIHTGTAGWRRYTEKPSETKPKLEPKPHTREWLVHRRPGAPVLGPPPSWAWKGAGRERRGPRPVVAE